MSRPHRPLARLTIALALPVLLLSSTSTATVADTAARTAPKAARVRQPKIPGRALNTP